MGLNLDGAIQKLKKNGHFKIAAEVDESYAYARRLEAELAKCRETIQDMAREQEQQALRIRQLEDTRFKLASIISSAFAALKVIEGEE